MIIESFGISNNFMENRSVQGTILALKAKDNCYLFMVKYVDLRVPRKSIIGTAAFEWRWKQNVTIAQHPSNCSNYRKKLVERVRKIYDSCKTKRKFMRSW